MKDVFLLLLTFALSGVLGNLLLQRWQQRSWLQQQRLLEAQKSVERLTELVDQIVTLAAARSYRARRLLRSIGAVSDNRLEEIRREYDQAVTNWNENISSFSGRLTLHANYGFAQRLEGDSIQGRFVWVGEELGAILRLYKIDPSSFRFRRITVEHVLNDLNGSIFSVYRDLLNELKSMQEKTFFGTKVEFTRPTCELFSSWYLFKALFKSNNPPQSVIGSLSHPLVPTVFRD